MKKITIPSKEEIEQHFLIDGWTKKECVSFYNVGMMTFTRWLRYYGIEKSPEIIKEQAIKKYGVANASQREEIKEKRKITNLEKYGCENPMQSASVKEKVRQTNLKKYGVECVCQSAEIRDKQKKTCLEKYGYENVFSSPDIKNQIKDTVQEKYGVEKIGQSKDVREKIKKTNIEKYGGSCYFVSKYEKNLETSKMLNTKEDFEAYLKSHEKMTMQQIVDDLDYSYTRIQHLIKKYNFYDYIKFFHGYSGGEVELRNYISSLISNCIYNSRDILSSGEEVDIYCPDKKIALEYNGTYWHSFEIIEDMNYHINKSKVAEKDGIRLIHIYEYEWNDPVKRPIIESLLKIAFGKVDKKIYARNCEIKKISNKEAKPFNEKNHLQGHRAAQVTYGLYYNNELVQLMSFSKTKYNRNLKTENSWEIIRGCPGSNNIVIGGVSKLFNHFVKDYNPNSVFSYCDFNKFDGKGYEALGMKFVGYTGVDMKWILKNGQVINRAPRKRQEIKNIARGRIYGAGSKKYLWEKSSL